MRLYIVEKIELAWPNNTLSPPLTEGDTGEGHHCYGKSNGQYAQTGMGLMAAILGMERSAAVEKTCIDTAKNGIVAPANYSSPGQIVIAGEKKAVERAMELARDAGAKKVIPL